MNSYLAQVEDVLRATTISPSAYTWFGVRSEKLPHRLRRLLSAEVISDYLALQLTSRLYADFYCSGGATPSRHEPQRFTGADEASFVEALSAANNGQGYWDDGWEAQSIQVGSAIVHKGGLELSVRSTEYRLQVSTTILASAVPVSLRLPKEYLSRSPGFYIAASDEPLRDEERSLVRVYWNITANGAIAFTRYLTTLLNSASLPFRLKVVSDPASFNRCDAAIVYLRRSDYEDSVALLKQLYFEVEPHLRPLTPALVKTLAPGVGLAEDPGGSESFGMHRCRLLAEAIIADRSRKGTALEMRLRKVDQFFQANGIDLRTPFLNAGSADLYTASWQTDKGRFHNGRSITPMSRRSRPVVYLRTAERIAEGLIEGAVWHRDQCNWLGADPIEQYARGRASAAVHRSLGPDLYSGTAGVAVVLAALHQETGDAALRATALGAIRHALSHVDKTPRHSALGLYSGWPGIALSAARVALSLDDDELLKHSASLLNRLKGQPRDALAYDLISGRAGAIAALLVLDETLPGAGLPEFAVQLGDELIQTARTDDARTSSWETTTFPTNRNLTGFSHGTAGVAFALLELSHAAGHATHEEVASQAFDYERRCFDEEAGNWPDFRRRNSRRTGEFNAGSSFSASWCHGAPGIALSRLRAFQLTGHELFRDEATRALETTHRATELMMQSSRSNFCLCHGLAGNAEVLLAGSEILGREGDRDLALQVADAGALRFGDASPWPCGTNSGVTPSLMLGLAGIAHFYLRLSNSKIPSVLIVH